MLGAQLHPGPLAAAGHRQRASSEASITPAWQATTTSSPGCRAASVVEGVGRPVDEAGPALARPGRWAVGVGVPVRVAEPLGESAHVEAVGLARVQLAEAAVRDQRERPSRSAPTSAGARISAVWTARGRMLA